MFSYFSPITFNTDVNTPVAYYNSGGAYSPFFAPTTEYNIDGERILGNGYRNPYMTPIPGYNIYTENTGGCSWGQQPTASTSSSIYTTTPRYNIYTGDFGGCLWQGGTNTNSSNYYTPMDSYNIYTGDFGGCLWGQSNPSTATSSANVESTSATTTAAKVEKSKETVSNPIKETKKSSKVSGQELRESFVTTAEQYMGYNEADGSYRKFSNSGEWCADFVAYVVKESYEKKGLKAPEDFIKLRDDRINRRVEDMKQWGIDNGKYLHTAGRKKKGQLIAEQIKPGDIMILRENDASHIGFVTQVNKDGSFKTIEGNRNDKVCTATYSPDYPDLSGFIRLTA